MGRGWREYVVVLLYGMQDAVPATVPPRTRRTRSKGAQGCSLTSVETEGQLRTAVEEEGEGPVQKLC